MKWAIGNIPLIAIYLLFFHTCLWVDSSIYYLVGIGYSILWIIACILLKKIFKNQYEFLFYQLVALDIFIEGFIPLHEGYTFYYCALAFWAVFTIYHFSNNKKFKCLCSGEPMEK